MIPLSLKIKRKAYKDIAYAQDIVIEVLYRFIPEAVLHGGTAILRCYGGNRFSEDIDLYIERNVEQLSNFFSDLEKKGFKVIKKRIKENSLYSELKFGEVSIRVEAVFKKVNFTLKEYETCESNFINVYTLTPEALLIEKINTYLKRKKVRDLYDIFFLLRLVKNKAKVSNQLKILISKFVPPEDETNLVNIVLSGPAPNHKQLLEYIERWEK